MRILHFSDVHLDARDLDATRKLIKKMIKRLKTDYGENSAFDLVVFSGDMILSGGRDKDNLLFAVNDGFNGFKEVVIDPICAALSLPIERFIVAIGNHDVDWAQASKDIQTEIKDLKTNDKIRSFYVKHIEPNHAPWISDYNAFRDALYATSPNYESHGAYANMIIPIKGKNVGISILNSAWGSLPSEKIVLLEQDQMADSIDDLDDASCDYRICVMHNPVQCFNDDEQPTIHKSLLNHYDVCFTGHTHLQGDYGITKEHHRCYLSTAPKMRTLEDDLICHDARYKDGFVVFEDTAEHYAVTTYAYADTREFVLSEKSETPKGSARNLKSISALFDLESELRVNKYTFLTNDAYNKIIAELRGDEYQYIRLSALSGFGKTRLLYQSFINDKNVLVPMGSHAYYCDTYPNNRIVLNEIKSVVENNPTKQGLIILDNCDWSLISQVINYMSGTDTQMRLIGVDNNPYEGSEMPLCHSILIRPDIIKDQVDAYIDKQLPLPQYYELKEDVKTLADGYPCMAYSLIETCLREGSVSISSIDNLVKRMLRDGDSEVSDDYQIVLQAMALFQPMPTQKGNKDAYSYIVNSRYITHLESTDEMFRRDKFRRVIRKYSPMLIEPSADWLRVRPYPLAIRLIQEWFEVMSDESLLEKLAQEIKQQPDHVSKLLTNSICKRIEGMQDSIPAQSLVEKLTKPGEGSFCSEKVVCSEMGSRLFLAMATVNPEKVAKSLRYLFQNKETEWLRENVKDNVRRNLVWALNKLCFAKESYADAVLVMAQFAMAENETWSNNSKSGISQLFPVQLPDTEVNLDVRFGTLVQLWDMGYRELALQSINVAFKNGNFVRMGGAEKFGWRHRDSYFPKTYGEIFRYWTKCKDLLLTWYQQDKSILPEVCKIAENHVRDWRDYGLMKAYLFPLIDALAPDMEWKWKKMYELLCQVVRFRKKEFTEESMAVVRGYIDKLAPTLFADTLLYTSRKVFDSDEDYRTAGHRLMEPLAARFIEEEIYKNPAEVRALVAMEHGEGFFMEELKARLSDSQLQQLLDTIWIVVEEQKNEFVSPIVNGILIHFREKESVQQFITKLWKCDYPTAYVRALAAIEDESMHSYMHLLELNHDGKLPYSQIEVYMGALWGLANEQMQIILPSLMENFPDEKESILDFVMRHRYWTEALGDYMHTCVRQLLLTCRWTNDYGFGNRDRITLIESYLQKYKEKDVDFGVQVNKRLIEILGGSSSHDDGFSELYAELLQEPYQSAIWEDFTDAVSHNFAFFYHVQFEIGSGFDFGAGPLFQYVSDERLKAWCKKDPENVPPRLANMAPVFNYGENGVKTDLSDFLKWIIEEYGEREDVLSCISSNMGTMSWEGSTIPLLRDMIQYLQPYTLHRYPTVRQWAQDRIALTQKDIEREQSEEDYMRMHYN